MGLVTRGRLGEGREEGREGESYSCRRNWSIKNREVAHSLLSGGGGGGDGGGGGGGGGGVPLKF